MADDRKFVTEDDLRAAIERQRSCPFCGGDHLASFCEVNPYRLPTKPRVSVGPDRRWTVTLDEMVAFAQQGWHYPLPDDEQTRKHVREWLEGDRPAPTPDGIGESA